MSKYSEAREAAKARKAKRKDNASFQAKVAGKKLRSVIKIGALKADIVKLLGWLDRKVNGPLCRLGVECPAFPKIGAHNGNCAYHLWPQKNGGESRFMPLNVVWACSAANCGEKWNREVYREKHVRVFGAGRMAQIQAAARIIADYSKTDLLAMREQIKTKLEQPSLFLPGTLQKCLETESNQ